MDFYHLRNCHLWIVRASGWLVFLPLANFEGERFPSKLVFGEEIQVFHGAIMEFLFVGVSYRVALGFL